MENKETEYIADGATVNTNTIYVGEDKIEENIELRAENRILKEILEQKLGIELIPKMKI